MFDADAYNKWAGTIFAGTPKNDMWRKIPGLTDEDVDRWLEGDERAQKTQSPELRAAMAQHRFMAPKTATPAEACFCGWEGGSGEWADHYLKELEDPSPNQ